MPPRLTGYSYRVDLLAGGEVDPHFGWVADYADLKTLFGARPRFGWTIAAWTMCPAFAGKTRPSEIADWIEGQLRPWPDWFEGVRVSVLGDGMFEPGAAAPR